MMNLVCHKWHTNSIYIALAWHTFYHNRHTHFKSVIIQKVWNNNMKLYISIINSKSIINNSKLLTLSRLNDTSLLSLWWYLEIHIITPFHTFKDLGDYMTGKMHYLLWNSYFFLFNLCKKLMEQKWFQHYLEASEPKWVNSNYI